VSFLILQFVECCIWESTPDIAVAVFGIDDTAMYSGLVRVIFKTQTSTERESKEGCCSKWSCDLEFMMKRTDTLLYIAHKKWSYKGADSQHIELACYKSVVYHL
jgi:hypothetical protein